MKKIILTIFMLMLICIPLLACTSTKTYHTQIKDGDVAKLTLYTFDGKSESKFGLMNLGHAFLSVENTSEEILTIGKVELSPHDSISIGTWSIQVHFGVWYNVESVYIDSCNKYDGRMSITTGVDKEDIEKLNSFILSHDYWTPTNNCSNFALNLWNTIADKDEELVRPFIYSPSKIAKSLKNFENYEINKSINTSIDKMFYFDENTPKYFSLEV